MCKRRNKLDLSYPTAVNVNISVVGLYMTIGLANLHVPWNLWIGFVWLSLVQVIDTEISKLNSLEPSSPEFNVCSACPAICGMCKNYQKLSRANKNRKSLRLVVLASRPKGL